MARALPSPIVVMIQEFVPWSDELLDDMLYTLKTQGGFFCEQKFDPPHKGIGKISVGLYLGMDRVKKGTHVSRIEASVSIKKNHTSPRG